MVLEEVDVEEVVEELEEVGVLPGPPCTAPTWPTPTSAHQRAPPSSGQDSGTDSRLCFLYLFSWLLYKVSNINSYIVTIIVVDIYQHLASLVQRFYTIDDGNVTNKNVSSRHNEMICITIFSLTPTPAKKHLLHGQRSQRFHSTPVPVRKPMSVPDIV